MHPMAYAFIAMAAAFGAVAAWVLFTGKTMGGTTETTVSSAVVATGTPSGDPETPSSAEPAGSAIQIAEVDVSPEAELAMAGSTAAAVSSNAKAPPPDSKTNSAKPCNPSDPFCGPAVEGPSTGGPSGDSGQAGQGLTPAQAQSVVNSNRHAVSRRCMSYVSGKGGSAKIGVTIVIAPSGNVQSVAVSGGKDYPGLASCVKTRVQNWKFPSSGASTTVNVSFNFIAQ
jgi:outer membrane biosynthesis protein TonB